MAGIVDVVSNSGEDFIDELTSAIVYDEGSKVFKKLIIMIPLCGNLVRHSSNR